MQFSNRQAASPITSTERIGEMDALRGFALLGVLIANAIGFSDEGLFTTANQLAALPTAAIDSKANFLHYWLIYDKANTLFSFLFGMGFWVMLERSQAKGAAFERIYLRRLGILTLFGFAHFIFIFYWEILHVYALAGFVLFALRGLSMRAMLITGLVLGVFGQLSMELLFSWIDLAGSANELTFSDAGALARQAASAEYWSLITSLLAVNWYGWVLNGGLIGWILYALGRFLIGAWVARKGWLQRAADLLPEYRKWLLILLPIGLAGELLVTLINMELVTFGKVTDTVIYRGLHYITAPTLAAGYVCAVVLAFHSRVWRFIPSLFAPVGRMALTNYVTQSFFIGALLYGFAFGLAGKIGAASMLGACIAFFACQIVFSHLWLTYFRFGPLEWAWRALTYGEKPKMMREAEQPAAA